MSDKSSPQHLLLFYRQSKCSNSAKTAGEMANNYKVRSIQQFCGVQSTEHNFKLVMVYHGSLKCAAVSVLGLINTAEATYVPLCQLHQCDKCLY